MFRLLHLSDTHLTASGGPEQPPGVDPEARLGAVLRAVEEAGFAPELIVHTGDVADDSSAHAVARVHERLTRIAPTVAVPGNHDDPALVREVFGPPRAVAGPWQVLGIDTVIPGAVEGHADSLPGVVAAATGPTILLMHHPIASHSTHPWFRVGNADQAEHALVASPHPWLVLSGHTHEVFAERRGVDGRVWLRGGPAALYALRHHDDTWEQVPHGTGAQLIELADDPGVVNVRVLAA